MAGSGSYFSRIMMKSVEIVAAAVATTISGYLIAHFSGYLASSVPLPAAIHAPITSTSGVSASQPARPVQASVSAQPIVPGSADIGQPHSAPPREVTPPARSTANAAPAVSPRKRGVTDTSAADGKLRDAELVEGSASAQDVTPPQPARSTANAAPAVSPRKRGVTDTSAAESKQREAESVEARVRAALAKVDSTRPVQSAVPPRQADVSAMPPAIVPPPRAAENAPGPVAAVSRTPDPAAVLVTPRTPDPVTVGAVPRAADPLPPPAQQPPVQSEPLTTVEIKSRPIASVDASPPQPPAAEEEDKGLFSAIKRIPDLLRSDTPPPSNEAPRPPMPVGD